VPERSRAGYGQRTTAPCPPRTPLDMASATCRQTSHHLDYGSWWGPDLQHRPLHRMPMCAVKGGDQRFSLDRGSPPRPPPSTSPLGAAPSRHHASHRRNGLPQLLRPRRPQGSHPDLLLAVARVVTVCSYSFCSLAYINEPSLCHGIHSSS
jgi:hypothetical protein